MCRSMYLYFPVSEVTIAGLDVWQSHAGGLFPNAPLLQVVLHDKVVIL